MVNFERCIQFRNNYAYLIFISFILYIMSQFVEWWSKSMLIESILKNWHEFVKWNFHFLLFSTKDRELVDFVSKLVEVHLLCFPFLCFDNLTKLGSVFDRCELSDLIKWKFELFKFFLRDQFIKSLCCEYFRLENYPFLLFLILLLMKVVDLIKCFEFLSFQRSFNWKIQ